MDTPNQNQPQIQQTVVVVGKQKSVGVAFLLAFLFGPLGLLYASVSGGIIMFILGIVIGIFTLGFGLIFVWIGCIIWAIVATNNANKNIGAGLNINTRFGGNPQSTQAVAQSQPEYQQPIRQSQSTQMQQPYTSPILQTPTPSFSEQIAPVLSGIGKFVSKNKIVLISILALAIATWIGYAFFLKSDPLADGKQASKMYCECSVKNDDRLMQIFKEFNDKFSSYNFKTQGEAKRKLDELSKGQLEDYTSCYEAAKNFYNGKKSKYIGNSELTSKFDLAFNQQAPLCNSDNSSQVENLRNLAYDKINQLPDPDKKIEPIVQASNTSSISGIYSQTSDRLLTYSDISGLSKYQLKIMRNEIFARHGYIFKTDDMKQYFKSQMWYKPTYDNVDNQLSKIEKENVEFIKSYEK